MSEEITVSLETPISEVTETPAIAETPETTVPVVVPVVVEIPEQRFEWQPTDDAGRPSGPKQVIKYRTEQEKFDRVVEQNNLILRELRKQKRNNSLGITEEDSLPETAQKIKDRKAFKSRSLTADEKIQLAQDMRDPDKIESALDRWAEARYGVPVEQQVETFNEIQSQMTKEEVEREALEFINTTPEYYGCADNFNVLAGWMAKHNLRATAENWKLAFKHYNDKGLMILGPGIPAPAAAALAAQPSVDGPSDAPPTPAREETPGYIPDNLPAPVVEAPKEFQRITTALNRGNTSDVGTVRTVGSDIVYVVEGRKDKKTGQKLSPDRTVYGEEAIDAMPSDVYKHRLLHESGFAKKVDELNRKAAEKQASKAFAQANG